VEAVGASAGGGRAGWARLAGEPVLRGRLVALDELPGDGVAAGGDGEVVDRGAGGQGEEVGRVDLVLVGIDEGLSHLDVGDDAGDADVDLGVAERDVDDLGAVARGERSFGGSDRRVRGRGERAHERGAAERFQPGDLLERPTHERSRWSGPPCDYAEGSTTGLRESSAARAARSASNSRRPTLRKSS